MKKLFVVALSAALALVLSGCELITGNDTKSSSDSNASKPSVHGSVVLTANSSLPSGAALRVAITATGPMTNVAIPRAPTAVSTGTYHKDIAVSTGGTITYDVTDVPDGSYTIVVTLMNSSQVAIGTLSKGKSIQVTGGACTVSDFTITYGNAM